MCCETVKNNFQNEVDTLNAGDPDRAPLAEIARDVKVSCPDYLKTHTDKILHPPGINRVDILDAVMSTKPDTYILIARKHGLLFPDSETALLAAQLAKIALREKEDEVPEFLQKDAPEPEELIVEHNIPEKALR